MGRGDLVTNDQGVLATLFYLVATMLSSVVSAEWAGQLNVWLLAESLRSLVRRLST